MTTFDELRESHLLRRADHHLAIVLRECQPDLQDAQDLGGYAWRIEEARRLLREYAVTLATLAGEEGYNRYFGPERRRVRRA